MQISWIQKTGLSDSQSESYMTSRSSGRYAQDPTTIDDGCGYAPPFESFGNHFMIFPRRAAELILAFDCGVRAHGWIGNFLEVPLVTNLLHFSRDRCVRIPGQTRPRHSLSWTLTPQCHTLHRPFLCVLPLIPPA
jgi:hypothetical protein